MNPVKVVTIVGARPQFVKMGPLSQVFKKRGIREVIVHTGQHYDYNLSDIFFKELRLFKPQYNLGINPAPSKGARVKASSDVSQISLMLKALEKVFIKEVPGLALTYGDTNSALACALVSAKLNIPLAHVEAGVRGFDRDVPEEINRLIIDRLSKLLFCPTKTAVENLKSEGVREGVFYTGDVMAEVLRENIKKINVALTPERFKKKGYILVTLHRQENVDRIENLKELVSALIDSDEDFIFPVHPRTKKNLKKFGLWKRIKGSITILEPQGYCVFLNLEKNASCILTDSGGVQKEAYLLKVPCITLRTTTEWPETLQNGWNRLISCKREAILDALKTKLRPRYYKNIFGSKKASEKIFEIIQAWLQKR